MEKLLNLETSLAGTTQDFQKASFSSESKEMRSKSCKKLNCRLDRRSVGLMVLGGFGFTAMGLTVLVLLDKSHCQPEY